MVPDDDEDCIPRRRRAAGRARRPIKAGDVVEVA
jgi:hypothetical protein